MRPPTVLLRLSLLLAAPAALARTRWSDLRSSEYTFDSYLREFGKSYSDPTEYQMRMALFNEELIDLETELRRERDQDRSFVMCH